MRKYDMFIKEMKGLVLEGKTAITSTQFEFMGRKFGLIKPDVIKNYLLTLEAQGYVILDEKGGRFVLNKEKLLQFSVPEEKMI